MVFKLYYIRSLLEFSPRLVWEIDEVVIVQAYLEHIYLLLKLWWPQSHGLLVAVFQASELLQQEPEDNTH